MVIAPARRAGDPGSNPGPGENFSLKLLIYIYNQKQLGAYRADYTSPLNRLDNLLSLRTVKSIVGWLAQALNGCSAERLCLYMLDHIRNTY